VFDAIVKSAVRLCDAFIGDVVQSQVGHGSTFRLRSRENAEPHVFEAPGDVQRASTRHECLVLLAEDAVVARDEGADPASLTIVIQSLGESLGLAQDLQRPADFSELERTVRSSRRISNAASPTPEAARWRPLHVRSSTLPGRRMFPRPSLPHRCPAPARPRCPAARR
jgi:hypothetical protein